MSCTLPDVINVIWDDGRPLEGRKEGREQEKERIHGKIKVVRYVSRCIKENMFSLLKIISFYPQLNSCNERKGTEKSSFWLKAQITEMNAL